MPAIFDSYIKKYIEMKINKPLSFFLILFVVLAVFMFNITFAGKIPGSILIPVRIGLIVLFFTAWRLLRKKGKKHAEYLAFTLMLVNLAFLIIYYTIELWNINLESPMGIALAKLNDSFFICLILIISFLFNGYKLKDIHLTRGRLGTGLIIGFFSFFLMGFLTLSTSAQPVESTYLKRNMVWILLFVLSNGFMEELLFRGIFLKKLNNLFKPVWSIILTAIVFAASHMQVTYTPDVLVFVGICLILGLIWGYLMHYTKSIIASMLFHAGADLMIIIPIYSSLGINV